MRAEAEEGWSTEEHERLSKRGKALGRAVHLVCSRKHHHQQHQRRGGGGASRRQRRGDGGSVGGTADAAKAQTLRALRATVLQMAQDECDELTVEGREAAHTGTAAAVRAGAGSGSAAALQHRELPAAPSASRSPVAMVIWLLSATGVLLAVGMSTLSLVLKIPD